MTDPVKRISRVEDCYIEPREGNITFGSPLKGTPLPLFGDDGIDDGRMVVNLIGYAIIPIEKYKAMVADLKSHAFDVYSEDTFGGWDD